jgi:RNA polymerase sigma-70 factor (ECF subfamily)
MARSVPTPRFGEPTLIGGPGRASDEELMLQFQRGEQSAFAQLVRRYQGPVYNFVARHLSGVTGADDVTQDTFARVVQNAVDFKHESKFSTWLFAIARNLCVDELRKRSHRKHPSLDAARPGADADGPTLGETVPDARADVERGATQDELRSRIARAVAALPDDQREVFLMREVANLPFKEIALATGVPENTVKSRMRYALERLQDALGDYEEFAATLK